jgi:23S rRNA pseudouridine955/2504/2580 synthase
MSGVANLVVASDEAELRLDRWFHRHFPELTHGRLEKLLRTGQVRVDGRRARAADRLIAGQTVRVPPLGAAPATRPAPMPIRALGDRDAEELRHRVLHRDAEVIALDKPAGLAVQGGTGTTHHLDAMLDALRFDAAERPRLVHRLDRDTSGVLLLARSARAAAWLGEAFKSRETEKVYWAATVGAPRPREGKIDLPIAKQAGAGGERMRVDQDDGKSAVTHYRVVDHAARRAAWVELRPLTGRTHQLRVHMAALGTPILGDGKYGGQQAMLVGDGLSRKLHLHARAIAVPCPSGRILRVTAPLPAHMAATWEFFGWSIMDGADG